MRALTHGDAVVGVAVEVAAAVATEAVGAITMTAPLMPLAGTVTETTSSLKSNRQLPVTLVLAAVPAAGDAWDRAWDADSMGNKL